MSRENRNPHLLSDVDCAKGLREYLHGEHLHPTNGRQSLEGWCAIGSIGECIRRVSFMGSIEIADLIRVDDVSSLCHVFRGWHSDLELRAAIVTGITLVLAVQALYCPSTRFVSGDRSDPVSAALD